MRREYILLTGATGFIGQYLLHHLLAVGRPVAVLVRAKHGIDPLDRVEHVLQDWERRLGTELPRPLCLVGDIRYESFGLSATDVHWVRDHVDTMLHNAALVEFGSRGRTIWNTNVDGTQHCVQLCQSTGIENLHYVSTAYVCGTHPEKFYESQLDCGQGFRNEYERSKFVAEQLVRSSAMANHATIYRPSVVMGDSRDGFATSFRGLYVLAQFTHMIAQHARRDARGRWHHPLQVNKSGTERRNIVPVDWVARVIAHIVGQPHLHGRTYHVIPGHPVSVAEIEAALRQYFNYYGVDLAGPATGEPGKRSSLEELFFSYLETYMPYWESDPEFDLSNTRAAMSEHTEPRIDVPSLIRMIEFAIRSKFGKLQKRRKAVAS